MKCVKCNYESDKNRKKKEVFLCNICYTFSPDTDEDFKQYINEKLNHESLETFRKYNILPGEKQKKAMIKKAIKGNLMSRAPFGYKIVEGKLVPDSNYKEVEEIFEEFLHNNLSLRHIAGKHKLSVNGLKKILRNFTYIGKVNFNNEIYEGMHKPLVSITLFNHVQNKLEKLGVK